MKRILVTGAAGYIGSHTCKALRQAGFEPIGIDNMERSGVHSLPWAICERVDIRDTATLAHLIERHAPVAVIHFAAYAYVGESVASPALYYGNNTLGTFWLLEALRAAGVDKIVFSSTCATYGVPEHIPITEDHPQHPINPYGASKLMVERMLGDYDRAYGLRFAALRYFNAAGADLDLEIGECHEPETHAIPLAIQAALGERLSFEIYGTDYPTADGTAVRDYIHVWDLARAHVLALEYLLSGGDSVALNLGTGKGISVRELVSTVESVTARSVPVRLTARRDGDPPVLVADPRKAARMLGWRAEITQFADIVHTAVQWQLKRHRAEQGANA